MAKFEEYFVPKQNDMFESKTCDFGQLKDSLIRDKIVYGIPDHAVRERLLRKQDLILDKAVALCRAAKTTKAQAKELSKQETVVHTVKGGQEDRHHMKPKQKTEMKRSVSKSCGQCAGHHKPRACPAYGKMCNKCGKDNHYARCCRSKGAKTKVHAVEEEAETFFVDSLQVRSQSKQEWIIPLEVTDTVMPFKQVNLISYIDYQTLNKKSKMHPVQIKVTGYTGENVPVKGGCIATLRHKGKGYKAQLLILDKDAQPILGLNACERLNLVKKVFIAATGAHTESVSESLLAEKFVKA
ncbi:hypothetical protein SRHO_G00270870 [Serrasalmus rhombeus]